MQWFQTKEHSAGKKRLILSWYLYKIFGKKALYLIAFLVSFFTFIFVPKVRFYSKRYFKIAYDEIGIEPNLINEFRQVYSYAVSLVDKILVYCGEYDSKNIIFENEEDIKNIFNDLNNKKGIFFICNHIGNIEAFQAYFLNNEMKPEYCANIFVSQKQSQIFNSFLNNIKVKFPVKLFLVEDIGLNTAIDLKESLDKGNMAIIAGDRLSENNDKKNIKMKLFNHEILLPKGTFKLAKLMNVPTYFISAIRFKDKYKIYLKYQEDLSEKELTSEYIKFMEKVIKIDPFQFYNFYYDFFL